MATVATPDEVERHFNHAVIHYSCGDVRRLMADHSLLCGTILAIVVNGIDMVGGMMKGFDAGSRLRSVAFMTAFMGLTPEVAELV